jgi:anthranilate phosphoribosyltransferase
LYRETIHKLIRRENLSSDEAASVMTEMMEGQLSPSQIGAFLALLAAKEETAGELAAFASVMREKATRVNAGDDLMDTCGTGGSGLVRTNTSTLAAFILASLRVRIAKHGNRASSGRCGSMDVLEALGVPIELGARQVEALIARCGISFMFAPRFHPAMANVGPVRREVGFRTTFNFLGPLANPASTTLQVLGVSDRRRAPLMIEALARLGSRSAMVVTGEDGLDEITLTGDTRVWTLKDGAISESSVSPSMVGLTAVGPESLRGGDARDNARIFLGVLDGTVRGPVRDLALINAAAGLLVAGGASNLRDGFRIAEEALEARRALEAFERYRDEARREMERSSA